MDKYLNCVTGEYKNLSSEGTALTFSKEKLIAALKAKIEEQKLKQKEEEREYLEEYAEFAKSLDDYARDISVYAARALKIKTLKEAKEGMIHTNATKLQIPYPPALQHNHVSEGYINNVIRTLELSQEAILSERQALVALNTLSR